MLTGSVNPSGDRAKYLLVVILGLGQQKLLVDKWLQALGATTTTTA